MNRNPSPTLPPHFFLSAEKNCKNRYIFYAFDAAESLLHIARGCGIRTASTFCGEVQHWAVLMLSHYMENYGIVIKTTTKPHAVGPAFKIRLKLK